MTSVSLYPVINSLVIILLSLTEVEGLECRCMENGHRRSRTKGFDSDCDGIEPYSCEGPSSDVVCASSELLHKQYPGPLYQKMSCMQRANAKLGCSAHQIANGRAMLYVYVCDTDYCNDVTYDNICPRLRGPGAPFADYIFRFATRSPYKMPSKAAMSITSAAIAVSTSSSVRSLASASTTSERVTTITATTQPRRRTTSTVSTARTKELPTSTPITTTIYSPMLFTAKTMTTTTQTPALFPAKTTTASKAQQLNLSVTTEGAMTGFTSFSSNMKSLPHSKDETLPMNPQNGTLVARPSTGRSVSAPNASGSTTSFRTETVTRSSSCCIQRLFVIPTANSSGEQLMEQGIDFSNGTYRDTAGTAAGSNNEHPLFVDRESLTGDTSIGNRSQMTLGPVLVTASTSEDALATDTDEDVISAKGRASTLLLSVSNASLSGTPVARNDFKGNKSLMPVTTQRSTSVNATDLKIHKAGKDTSEGTVADEAASANDPHIPINDDSKKLNKKLPSLPASNKQDEEASFHVKSYHPKKATAAAGTAMKVGKRVDSTQVPVGASRQGQKRVEIVIALVLVVIMLDIVIFL